MASVQEIINRIMEGGRINGYFKERQKEKIRLDNPEQYPKVPSGFQCFVCGKQFAANQERIKHLGEEQHGSMYDTTSPQESEDTRRLR